MSKVAPIEVELAGLRAGEGVDARLIASGVPGDQVELEDFAAGRTPRTKRHDRRTALPRAAVTKLVQPSPHRVSAPCDRVDRCGACVVQALDYREQLVQKRASLLNLLTPLRLQPQQLAPFSEDADEQRDQPQGYRTRLLMPAFGRPGDISFGFYGRDSREPVAAMHCVVQHPATLAILAQTKTCLDQNRIAPSTGRKRQSKGWLHGILIRVDPNRGAGDVTLIGRDNNLPEAVAERLLRIPEVEGVHLNINPARSSYLLGETFVHLRGARRLAYQIADVQLQLSPGAFLQTHHQAAHRLIDLVRAAMPAQVDCLADLYGGVGVFAWATQDRWRRAIVAEANPHAIADLEQQLEAQSLPITAIAGRLGQTIGQALAHQPDVIIVDPPRRGCEPTVIDALKSSNAQLIYVACSPNALVDDLIPLCEAGYRVKQITPVDMFPHTTHVELVALLSR